MLGEEHPRKRLRAVAKPVGPPQEDERGCRCLFFGTRGHEPGFRPANPRAHTEKEKRLVLNNKARQRVAEGMERSDGSNDMEVSAGDTAPTPQSSKPVRNGPTAAPRPPKRGLGLAIPGRQITSVFSLE